MDTDSIEVGDIFEDNDSRMMRCSIAGPGPAHMRRVRVIGFFPDYYGAPDRCSVVDVTTGLHTAIKERRLRTGGSRGFTRVK